MRIAVLSDIQYPEQDNKAIDSVLSFLSTVQPDILLCVGDELDAPEPSRWNKGRAGEFTGTLQKSIDGCHNLLARFREVMDDRPFHLMRSNHGDRIKSYLAKYAEALSGLRCLQYDQLLGLDDLGITFHDKPYEFAPGWVLAHGDEGSLIQTAGGTALGLAKRWGKSVVCGHTHRAGLQHHHLYLNGKPNTLLFGMEVGHLMDIRKANYLKAGSSNWQTAIGLIDVDGKHVTPTLIPLFGSKVRYEGVTY